MSRWTALAAALLVSVPFVSLAAHGQREATSSDSFTGGGIELRDRSFDNLRIAQATGVLLANVTVRGTLEVQGSSQLAFEGVRVGRGAFLSDSSQAVIRALQVTGTSAQSGTLGLSNVGNVTLQDLFVNFRTDVTGSRGVRLEGATLRGTYCETASQVAIINSSIQYRTCPGDYTAPHENPDYTFSLRGGTVSSSVYVNAARPVEIRDVRIEGDLAISRSQDVVLSHVQVTGSLFLNATSATLLDNLTIGGHALLFRVDPPSMGAAAQGSGFRFVDSSIGGGFTCRESRGSLANVHVAGRVDVGGCDLDGAPTAPHDPPAERNVTASPAAPSPSPPPVDPPAPGPTSSSTSSVPAATPPHESVRMEANATFFSFIQPSQALARQEMHINVQPQQGSAQLRMGSAAQPGLPSVQVDSRFEKLIEFEDRDGNDAYDLGDQVLREFVVADLPVVGMHQANAAASGWTGRVDYGLPQKGTLALAFTAREAVDHTKVDVGIHAYPYMTPTSRLALQVRLESASDWSIRDDDQESRLTFHGAGVDGYFSWLRTADADGAPSRVTARVLEEHRTADDHREIRLFLGYARASNILHDPAIGVVEPEARAVAVVLQAPRLGDPVPYAAALAATVLVLLGLGALRRSPPLGKA